MEHAQLHHVREWEPLKDPLVSRVVRDRTRNENSLELELVRDDSLAITGVLRGAYHAAVPAQPAGLRTGELIPRPDAIVLQEADGGRTVTLEATHVLQQRRSFSGGEPEASLRVGRAILAKPNYVRTEPATCSLWCVNGPNSRDFILPRETFRVGPRTSRVLESDARWREGNPRQSSRDWMWVPHPRCPGQSARFGRVPTQDAPEGLGACSIEFQLNTSAPLPEVADFESYLGALSFALGRRLVPIGVALFDASGEPFFQSLQSAWTLDLRRACDHPAEPPVSVRPAPELTQCEEVVALLVPAYLGCADELHLDDALRFSWLAGCVPLEAALPPLASALECVVGAWFKSTRTKTGGKYLDDETWRSLSSDGVATLEAALAGRAMADRIMRRVRAANLFGANERIERFFEEVELPIGDVEARAMQSRNRPAHGDALGEVAPQGLLSTVHAYRTLLNRVILAVIGWKGGYIDYSTLGNPIRALADRLGGPEDNGVAAEL